MVHSETGLARIPLLPAEGPHDHSSTAVNPLLVEGMLLVSRQAGAAAMSAVHPVDDRFAATLRGYEIRARLRPTPNAVFAGVAPAVFSREAASLCLGGGHRARSNPSAAWLTAVCAQLVEDPDALSLLTLTASNLITRRGQRLEHEQQAAPGGTGPRRVTVRDRRHHAHPEDVSGGSHRRPGDRRGGPAVVDGTGFRGQGHGARLGPQWIPAVRSPAQ